jgi:N-formylglutamate deformylase
MSTDTPALAPPIFKLQTGDAPLLVSLPHAGTHIPPALAPRFQPRALEVPDTDWHLDQLYRFVHALGASLITPSHSRYVIDLNRPPENTPMYAGANNTELCPTRAFTGEALYREGQAPNEAEVAQRVQSYWQPYHQALRAELQRLRERHGHVVLFDGHSIKSELPWLFEGRLPDLNLGTAEGRSCAPSLRRQLAEVLGSQSEFTQVVDGRFKGGHITRFYGQPEHGVHAVQLEMCWRCYMDEAPPWRISPQRQAHITPVLRRLVEVMLAWRPSEP